MNALLIALLCAFCAATDDPAPKVVKPARKHEAPAAQVDPVQQEYERLLEQDEAALKEVEKLEREFGAFAEKGAAGPRAALAGKIEQTLAPVKKGYEEFLLKHPKHVEALIAYGSFLNETGEEEDAIVQWEKARSIDPKNPSPWNNLANVFGHIGPIKKAFQYYEKAIELDPTEAVYVQNLAIVTYLFRKDAAETYRIDEEAVFNKALDLYRQAMKLDPTNLVLATDFAQSYYGIKPLRTQEALTAWKHALTVAKTDVEKQGIYLHLARIEWMSDMLPEAEQHLALVQAPEMDDLKARVRKNIDKKKADAARKKPAGTKLEASTP